MTSIERLPNELWLEIFSYIPSVDLFICFSELNQRINSILFSTQIKFKLKTKLIYEKSKILIEKLPEDILSLSIEYYNQDIDISLFKNLLSLHLSHATNQQIIQIQSNDFKYLKQLNIVVCSTDYQLGNILFNENQFNYLTKCWLPNLDSYFQDNKSYQSCLTLRSLRLNYCHINTFFKLLPLLPNLISFQSALVPLPSSNESISFPLIKHFNLIRLKIFLRKNVSLTDLESLLSYVPCLKQFYLNINESITREEESNLVQLINFLENRPPNIKKCDIKINLFSTNFKINQES